MIIRERKYFTTKNMKNDRKNERVRQTQMYKLENQLENIYVNFGNRKKE